MIRPILPWLATLGAACAASTALATTPAATTAPTTDATHRTCLLTSNWESWTAPGDGDVILLRGTIHDYYRLDLTPGTHVRKYPDYFLVNRVRGSSWLCSPLDFDLTVSDHNGFRQPIIVRAFRKLTPEEVAAIPKRDLP